MNVQKSHSAYKNLRFCTDWSYGICAICKKLIVMHCSLLHDSQRHHGGGNEALREMEDKRVVR